MRGKLRTNGRLNVAHALKYLTETTTSAIVIHASPAGQPTSTRNARKTANQWTTQCCPRAKISHRDDHLRNCDSRLTCRTTNIHPQCEENCEPMDDSMLPTR